jgi:hypothetical protein
MGSAMRPASSVPATTVVAPGWARPVRFDSATVTTPISVKTTSPKARINDASISAGASGRPRAVMTPSCSLEVSRDDRMPPRAPACETNGGINRYSAGTNARAGSRAWSSPPARMSSKGVNRMTPVISSTILRTAAFLVVSPLIAA